jgi:hypothetical protein
MKRVSRGTEMGVLRFVIVATALSIACVTESEPTEIRIRNVSGFDYDGLQVGDQTFGSLPAGAETRYRDFGTAYRYNYVRLEIEGDEMILQPVDYVGETPLGPERFTYEVRVIDRAAGQLGIDVVED